jgi:DNA-binding MarR family transcriptional regulator
MEYKISKGEGKTIDMSGIDNRFFLIGLLNEFMNRFQTVSDHLFGEISWKQCFVLICIQLFDTPPSLRELSEVFGTSHQNVKQILIKLEKAGYVTFIPDPADKRKQRIALTEKAEQFSKEHNAESAEHMQQLFEAVPPADVQTTIDTILRLDAQLKILDGKAD